jgi:hypothetical protein
MSAEGENELDRAARRLGSVINSMKCLQVKKFSANKTGVSFLCGFTNEARWGKIMNRFLVKERGLGWKSFIAKKYFVSEEQGSEGQVVAGWSISFKASDPVGTAERVGAILIQSSAEVDGSESMPSGGVVDYTVSSDFQEVVEAPYHHRPGRNQAKHKDGKGAWKIGEKRA